MEDSAECPNRARKVDVNVRDEDGTTALCSAAEKGHIEIVKLLLDAKADVTPQDSKGRTVLHLTASCGHTEAVKMLLNAKADTITQDESGSTALHLAAKNGHGNCQGVVGRKRMRYNTG